MHRAGRAVHAAAEAAAGRRGAAERLLLRRACSAPARRRLLTAELEVGGAHRESHFTAELLRQWHSAGGAVSPRA
jgi:hypothetical protein